MQYTENCLASVPTLREVLRKNLLDHIGDSRVKVTNYILETIVSRASKDMFNFYTLNENGTWKVSGRYFSENGDLVTMKDVLDRVPLNSVSGLDFLRSFAHDISFGYRQILDNHFECWVEFKLAGDNV